MKRLVHKSLVAFIAACSLIFPGTVASAKDTEKPPDIVNTEKADALKEIGLFVGTEKGYELDRPPTRVEGAIMLLRLLGKEEEAKNSDYVCPFTDVPNWASKQIGYMYANKLTNGISAQSFGAGQDMTASQYVAFVLRALGYSDEMNDFPLQKSIDKATDISLLSNGNAAAIKKKDTFLRDDLVGISYNALFTLIKESDSTLIKKLILEDNTVAAEAAEKAGVWHINQGNKSNTPTDTPVVSSLVIENSCEIAKEYLAQNGLAYTMTDAVESIDKQHCHLMLLFHIRNAVYPEAPEEQNFKIYYDDGTARYQSFSYGPIDSRWKSREITLDIYDGRRVVAIELGPDPLSDAPERDTLKWDIRAAVEQAVTQGDSKAPVLESIEILQNTVSAGDKVIVSAVITDKVGIKGANVQFLNPKGQNSLAKTNTISISLTRVPGTDIWKGEHTISRADTKGLWKLNCVILEDTLYNSRQINSTDLSNISFTIR